MGTGPALLQTKGKRKNISCSYPMNAINWASEASPTLGCSIEISRDIYIYVYMYVGMSRMSN